VSPRGPLWEILPESVSPKALSEGFFLRVSHWESLLGGFFPSVSPRETLSSRFFQRVFPWRPSPGLPSRECSMEALPGGFSPRVSPRETLPASLLVSPEMCLTGGRPQGFLLTQFNPMPIREAKVEAVFSACQSFCRSRSQNEPLPSNLLLRISLTS
jgi:hypothetical protein